MKLFYAQAPGEVWWWFAWHPVRLWPTNRVVWLEWVGRAPILCPPWWQYFDPEDNYSLNQIEQGEKWRKK